MSEKDRNESLKYEDLIALKKRLETPIDFDKLVAEGKLERISATKYKLLDNDLPEYVTDQIVGLQLKGVNKNDKTIKEIVIVFKKS